MRRILIVDDERMMVRTLSEILRLHGWETESAFSGEHAVGAVERQHFDAVLMDVRMEGITGVEALRRMKQLRPGLRVLLMTAYTASDLLAEAEREGALRVLPKPLAIPALLAMLEASVPESHRVLVVDDNPEFLRTLALALEERGFVVARATSLAEALSALAQTSPAVVILDLCLDHLTPSDTVVAIKRMSPSVALILYSGDGQTLDATAAFFPESWVHATLRKPFPPDHLIQLLDDLFAH